MRWTFLVFAVGCVSGCLDEGPGDDLCIPGPTPTLAIGEGAEGYVPVAPGGDLPLLEGVGGAQTPIGLFATHLDASDLADAHLEARIAGAVRATADASVDFRCDLDAGGLVTFGTLLVWDASSAELAGETAAITATVTDVAGAEATVTTDFVLQASP
jgi:hypothetical protein